MMFLPPFPITAPAFCQSNKNEEKWTNYTDSGTERKTDKIKLNNKICISTSIAENIKNKKDGSFTLLCRRMRSSIISSELLERLNDFC